MRKKEAVIKKPLIPDGMTLPEMALRFILSNREVSVTIPGMRRINHVASNMNAGDGKSLKDTLLKELKKHRWDREVTEWSQ